MDHKLDVNRQSQVTGNSLLHVLVEEGNFTLLEHLLRLPQVDASLNAESHLGLLKLLAHLDCLCRWLCKCEFFEGNLYTSGRCIVTRSEAVFFLTGCQ